MFSWKSKSNNSDTNAINSREYGECLKRIAELDTKLISLDAKVKVQELTLDNLRGKFSAKLKGIKQEEAQEEEKKDLYVDGNIPFG
jgi:hypothetical protein